MSQAGIVRTVQLQQLPAPGAAVVRLHEHRKAEALADLVERYDAIGGISPLAVLTENQRDGLQAALDDWATAEPGLRQIAEELGLGMVAGEAVDLLTEGQPGDSQTLEYIHARKSGAVIAGALEEGGEGDSMETHKAELDGEASEGPAPPAGQGP